MQAPTPPAHPSSRRAGAAPIATPLLLLHSSGSGSQQWRRHFALLPAGVPAHAPDLLGYDGRPWAPDAPVTLDAEAQRLVPWLLAQSEPVHVFGHSYGGAVALQLALRWPDRVARLTLYEPVRFALLRACHDPLWADIERVGRRICELARAGEPEAAARCFVDYWSGAGTWQAMPAARQEVVAQRMAKVGAEFDALFSDPLPPSALRGLQVPVGLLQGTRSPRPAQRIVERLAELLPCAERQVLAGLGHMGPVEDASRVLRAVFPETVGDTAIAA